MTTDGQVTCEMSGDVAIATVAGEFDISNCDEMRLHVQAASANASGLILDLTQAVYMDSAAIRTVLSLGRAFQSRGGTVVAVVPADGLVRKVTMVSGFDVIMPVVETREEALRIAGAPGA